MSHFTVAVRLTEDRLARHGNDVEAALDEILAPFDENVQKGDKYAEFNDVTDEYRKEYDEDPEHQKKYPTFEKFMREYGGYRQNDAGRWGYWRNPNKKWDWYSIGGRWRGYFPVKADTIKQVGRPGAFDNAPKDGSDIVRRDQLDFDKVAIQEQENFDRFKSEYRRYLAGEKFQIFEGPREDMLSMGLLRVEMDPTAALKDKEVQVGGLWGEEHRHIKGTDRENWRDVALALTDAELEKYRPVFNPLRTYAALDDDGWHAPGEMGWFGMSDDTPEAYLAYAETFVEKFIKGLGEHDLLVLVDCHI